MEPQFPSWHQMIKLYVSYCLFSGVARALLGLGSIGLGPGSRHAIKNMITAEVRENGACGDGNLKKQDN